MNKNTGSIIAVFAFAALLTGLGLTGARAQPATPVEHKLAIQVSSNNLETMSLAINNAMAAKRYYDAHHEKIRIEIVAYGPGITMLRSDTSPLKDRISELRKAVPDIALDMCNNAKMAAEKREGHEIVPLPGVTVVPAGVVRLMELQEQGWSYIRP